MNDRQDKLQRFIVAYLYGAGAAKPDTWAEDLARLIEEGWFPAIESEIREEIAATFDAEAAKCEAKVMEYGVMGLGAIYARERDIAERNARNVRNPL